MSLNEQELLPLKDWLQNTCALKDFYLYPLIDDASFRRYFRIQANQHSYVVMLAPPDKENITAFITIAKDFARQGIHVPEIIAYDLQRGFVLLSDLGDDLYLQVLNTENADDLYTRALSVILQIQTCRPQLSNNQPLALFDESFIRFELNLFVEWFLRKHLKFDLTNQFKTALEKSFNLLIAAALEQPQVCIHRDYHSRNLLLLNNKNVGVLDFQDALYGPIIYDAASLLRDAYIDWPEIQVEQWALYFHHMLKPTYQLSQEEFLRWFDFLSIQRHLKILGIFARLYYRDNKSQYLASTKRLLHYLQQTCQKYSELKQLQLVLQLSTQNRSQEIEKK
jgi:N-acetylmuramate 1-kinase